MTNNYFQKNEKILVVVGCVITFLLCVCTVFQRNMIVMSADEMGPISIAAYWNGYDWSEVMSHGSYYSYGYSIVLFPLFFLFKSPEMFLKSVIVANSVFSALIFLFSWLIAKEIKPESKPYFRLSVALFCGCFVSNIARSSSAWDEVFLAFLCWTLLFSFIKVYKKGNIPFYLLGSFLSFILYITHQRMIGVFFVFHVFVFFISLFDIKRFLKFLTGELFLIGLFIGHIFIKRDIKANVWRNSANSEINDYSSVLRDLFGENYIYTFIILGIIMLLVLITIVLIAVFLKKKGEESKSLRIYRWILTGLFVSSCLAGVVILNLDSIKLALYSVSAQLLYAGISSFGLVYLGILFSLVNFFCWVKNGAKVDYKQNDLIYNYVLFAFLSMFFISEIVTHPVTNPSVAVRSDYLFYGRYFEPMLALVAFAGAINLDIINERKWAYFIPSLLMIIFNIPAIRRYNLCFKGILLLVHNCVALDFFSKNGVVNFVLATAVMSVFLFLFILLKKDSIKTYVMLACIVLAFAMGLTYIERTVMPADKDKYAIKEVLEVKETLDPDAPLVFYGNEPDYIYNSSFIQYLMKNHKSLRYGDKQNIPDTLFYGITDDAEFLGENPNLYLVDRKNEFYLFTNIKPNEN
ncbi:hypothetical protein SAMN04487760_104106 [Lachnospiraceae bacterium G41]|nr:hypothetical protein SAMN04487760_104106 [Lachnospiraceae bacterium G41]